MMTFLDKIFTRKGPVEHKNQKHQAVSGTQPDKRKASRPVFSRVGPGQAVGTPLRYDRLADEGYRRNVVVYRSVSLVSRAIASIPLKVTDGTQVMSDHPLINLLQSPNPRVNGSSFLYNMVSQYLIAGNAYILKVGPENQTTPARAAMPSELWLLRPDTCQVVEGTDGLPSAYKQTVAGKSRIFDAENVMHWKTFNPLSDWYGMAPLEAAALAIDSHNEGSRWNLALIQNGGAPSGVLYQPDTDMVLTDKQFGNLKNQIEEQYTGAVNAGRPLLLEGGLRWQDMGLSPKDMDWTSAKNMTAREIAQAFGVPPQMLGLPDAQTYANYAEARLSLWEDTVIPMAKELMRELGAWLGPYYQALPQNGRPQSPLTITLDLDDIPALEIKRQAKFERVNTSDFLTVNEKRHIMGYADLEDADGDRLMKPMTMI